jgi:HSP90 family molecular chaperone
MTASAIWTKPKASLTEEQYQEFYRHVAHSSRKTVGGAAQQGGGEGGIHQPALHVPA